MRLIRIHPSDNVAVALQPLEAGQVVDLPWGGSLELKDAIPVNHKVALTDLEKGAEVVRYGQPIGTTTVTAERGSWLHSHNLREPVLQQAAAGSADYRPADEPLSGPSTFMGYVRPTGRPGIRNYAVIIPTVACAVGVARAIARSVPEAVVIEHTHGCGRSGPDFDRTLRVILGCGLHPNTGAVLLVGLGCEVQSSGFFLPHLKESQKPFEYIEIQKEGGSRASTRKGIDWVRKMVNRLKADARTPHPITDLLIGLQCGGSDALSGITANPAVGCVSDWLAERGATVILAETTEMIGTQHLLQARAAAPAIAEDIDRILKKNQKLARTMLGEFAHLAIAPGNMDGGLSTIMEKSMGCIAKGGHGPIQEIVPYGQTPQKTGLVIMDTPGYDIESLAGLVGAGCQAIFFTTGRGTPVGAPLAPVIKVSSNSAVAAAMPDDIDIDAGRVAEGAIRLEQAGQELLDALMAVAEGRQTCAEKNLQDVMGISTTMEAL